MESKDRDWRTSSRGERFDYACLMRPCAPRGPAVEATMKCVLLRRRTDHDRSVPGHGISGDGSRTAHDAVVLEYAPVDNGTIVNDALIVPERWRPAEVCGTIDRQRAAESVLHETARFIVQQTREGEVVGDVQHSEVIYDPTVPIGQFVVHVEDPPRLIGDRPRVFVERSGHVGFAKVADRPSNGVDQTRSPCSVDCIRELTGIVDYT